MNAQPSFETLQQQTPDITLSGATLDRLFQHLTSPVILAKDVNGTMHSFVDPQPVLVALREAVLVELNRKSGVMNG